MNGNTPDPGGFLRVNVAGQNHYIPVYSGDEEEVSAGLAVETPEPKVRRRRRPERWGILPEMLAEIEKKGL